MMIHTSNQALLLVQCGCFTTTLVLALMLLMSRYLMRMHTPSRAYDTSRWLLVIALSLYASRYLLQMVFGFRAKNPDLGAMVNILFYLPMQFTTADLAAARLKANLKYTSNPSVTLSRWAEKSWIRKLDTHTWQRLYESSEQALQALSA